MANAPSDRAASPGSLRERCKAIIRRALRPALWDLQQSVLRLEASAAEDRRSIDAIRTHLVTGASNGAASNVNASHVMRPASLAAGSIWRGGIGGAAFRPDGSLDSAATGKYHDELSYWVAAVRGRDPSFGDRFESIFGTWQTTRLDELADRLSIDRVGSMDEWCAARDVIEIGGGPFPSCSMRRFRSAIAVDPLADGYALAGLVPAIARERGVVLVSACGESIPIASASADLVIAENCLDHTDDPRLVVSEIRRLLRPDGLLWLLVDFMDYSDHVHPNPMSSERLDALLLPLGFEYLYKQAWEGASHPMAKVQCRCLLRRIA
jgi:SAM-dependent methyltransferase